MQDKPTALKITTNSKGRKRNIKKIKRVSSILTLEDLKRLDKEGIPAKQHTDGLHLKDIHVAPRVFQWRLSNENLLMAEEHIRELAA